MTAPFAAFDPRLKGVWVNPDIGWGFHLLNRRKVRGWFRRTKIIYDYHPEWTHPTHWLQVDGTAIAAGDLLGTDQGSVPIFAQRWMPKDGLLGYYPHDYAYRYAGLFFKYRGEDQFKFRRVTRSQADALLRASGQHDPVARVGCIRAALIWSAVRIFAGSRFHEWRGGNSVPTVPEDSKPDVDPEGGYGGVE